MSAPNLGFHGNLCIWSDYQSPKLIKDAPDSRRMPSSLSIDRRSLKSTTVQVTMIHQWFYSYFDGKVNDTVLLVKFYDFINYFGNSALGNSAYHSNFITWTNKHFHSLGKTVIPFQRSLRHAIRERDGETRNFNWRAHTRCALLLIDIRVFKKMHIRSCYIVFARLSSSRS